MIKSLRASIDFDGEWITIRKKTDQWRSQERRIHVDQITSVTLATANIGYHGYIQFAGPSGAAAVKRHGTAKGRPPREDMDSMSFSRKHNAAMAELKLAVEDAMARRGAMQGPAPVTAPPQPAAPAPSFGEQFQQLAAMHTAGQLTDEEFAAAKARLLNP